MIQVRRVFWSRSCKWRRGQFEAGQCRSSGATSIQWLGTQRVQRCRHSRSGNCEGCQVGRRISRSTRGEEISFGERWREVGRDLGREGVCRVQRPVSTTRKSPRRGRRIQEGRTGDRGNLRSREESVKTRLRSHGMWGDWRTWVWVWVWWWRWRKFGLVVVVVVLYIRVWECKVPRVRG